MYVLIITLMISSNWNTDTTIIDITFTSQTACESAKTLILSSYSVIPAASTIATCIRQ